MAAVSQAAAVSAAPIAPTPSGNAKPALDLQAKLDKCVRQLSDWQGCPSGKTPQGKQIIQDLQTQIRNLEGRIASADQPSLIAGAAALRTSTPNSGNRSILTTGSLVDAYA